MHVCCTAQPEELQFCGMCQSIDEMSHRAYIMCACACISLKLQTCVDSTGMLNAYIHMLCVCW